MLMSWFFAVATAAAITVRTKSEPLDWQTVRDWDAEIRWAWTEGADSARITASNRVTHAVVSLDVARAEGEFDGVGTALNGDETIIDLKLVQRAGGEDIAASAASLAYVGGVNGEPLVIRRAVNRDWEHFCGTHVGLADPDGKDYQVYRGYPTGSLLIFR